MSSHWCGLKGEERREVAKEYSLAVATVAAGRAAAAFGFLSSMHHYMLPKHTHLENLAYTKEGKTQGEEKIKTATKTEAHEEQNLACKRVIQMKTKKVPHLQDIIQKNLTTKIAKRNYFAEQISGPL
jgi:hypothetical protein